MVAGYLEAYNGYYGNGFNYSGGGSTYYDNQGNSGNGFNYGNSQSWQFNHNPNYGFRRYPQ